jgi:hypothetical protein
MGSAGEGLERGEIGILGGTRMEIGDTSRDRLR